MQITIITDNTIYKPETNSKLKKEWGFSCLIEDKSFSPILFDTGASGEVLLSNMKALNINPTNIAYVFISHDHFDHTGGLEAFLKQNSNVTLYLPETFLSISKINAKKVIRISQFTEILKNVYSTGELENIEQSLAIKTKKGVVVIAGCSHPGVDKILNAASEAGKVFALIGGLHGFREFEILESLELICPTHCTQHIEEIKKLYPEKYVEGGAGKVIDL